MSFVSNTIVNPIMIHLRDVYHLFKGDPTISTDIENNNSNLINGKFVH